jgi:hypothetical protein
MNTYRRIYDLELRHAQEPTEYWFLICSLIVLYLLEEFSWALYTLHEIVPATVRQMQQLLQQEVLKILRMG